MNSLYQGHSPLALFCSVGLYFEGPVPPHSRHTRSSPKHLHMCSPENILAHGIPDWKQAALLTSRISRLDAVISFVAYITIYLSEFETMGPNTFKIASKLLTTSVVTGVELKSSFVFMRLQDH